MIISGFYGSAHLHNATTMHLTSVLLLLSPPQFVSSEMVKALETDSLLSSHPVEVEIKDPDEIEQVFDNLSYSKGASILRQLNAAVGPLSFQRVCTLTTGGSSKGGLR